MVLRLDNLMSLGGLPIQKGVKIRVCFPELDNVLPAMENNENVSAEQIRIILGKIKTSVDQIQMDYFGELISLEEYQEMPEENEEKCQEILAGNFRRMGSLIYLPLEVAQAAGERGEKLFCGNVKKVGDRAAEFMKDFTGEIWLGSVKELSEEFAKILGMNKSWLSLNGLENLSEKVADYLGKHEGELSLNGLKSIHEDVARGLVQHKGRLALNGLVGISDEVAEILSNHEGQILTDTRIVEKINKFKVQK